MTINPQKEERTYELVARTNGFTYSMKLQREKIWRHFKEEKGEEAKKRNKTGK